MSEPIGLTSMWDLVFWIGQVLAATFAAAVIHESGHALATLACGVRLRAFVLGIGPDVVTLHLGPTALILKAVPITGHVAHDLTKSRWASLAMAAGGPMANLIALGLMFIVYLLHPNWGPILLLFGFYEAFFVVSTLVPISRSINGVKIGSDGMKIFNLLFRYKVGT